ncbi:MAG: bifunctional precorrin-2 dehydrogenase/sirohydrochlorin ferrochelatase [Desulfomonile tiedjei]|uniref:precorrin-2 dehydrogenase n=1 Tax=Desulfomonile tiedjei TaxID=2358 RepID=A0A9D6UXS7_9BACT|nr:bifunctional precorrin-2 dehydrogenase/sirohydrochlorin ferrochelatase [Desulfomonile tiedjei]
MKPYPVMMNLEGRKVLVVGGGRVARRKAGSLLESGASVVVISPELETELQDLAKQAKIEWVPGYFDESLLDRYPDATLVFGTTNNRDVNVRVHRACLDRRIPCNIADVPDLCTFIVPAVITQGDLMIAVSTGGSSPALARRIREDLEQRFGPEYAEMTRVMGDIRKLVLAIGMPSDENKKLFTEILDSGLLDALKNNDRQRVLEILGSILPKEVDPKSAAAETADN